MTTVAPGAREVIAKYADGVLRTAELLQAARHHERLGHISEAMDCCMAAVAEAAWCGAWAAQAVGLRRLGVLHHRRNEVAAARETCRTAVEVAIRAGEPTIAVEALLALGNFEAAHGNLAVARAAYNEALEALGDDRSPTRARIEHHIDLLGEPSPSSRDGRAA